MQTIVNVRVQANGGKYLGPALGKAHTPPVLTVAVPGQAPLGPFSLPTTDSGEVVSKQDATSSPLPIVVQPAPSGLTVNECYAAGTFYLDPRNQPALPVFLELPEEPTDVVFTVTAYAPQPVTVSAVVTLSGGDTTYGGDPGLVIVVPGLRITELSAIWNIPQTVVTANVAMMCGCQIGANNACPDEPFWPAYEFAVIATAGGMSTELTCTDPMQPSVYGGVLPALTPGELVTVTAAQRNSANSNSATTAVVRVLKAES